MNFVNERIKDNIENLTINGQKQKYTFEHDSLKIVWEHYKKIYFNKEGMCTICEGYSLIDLNQLVLANYKYDKIKRQSYYYNEPSEKWPYVNRYYLIKANHDNYTIGATYPGEDASLSGECDFNFNEKKYSFYRKKLEEEYSNSSKALKSKLAILKKCKENHHSLINFSLMQSKGNMQGFKGICLDNGIYYSLDRPDTLLAYLSSYYQLNDEQKENSYILANAGNNKDTLKQYLNSFEDVYEYCEKIYLINDKNFIDRMIKEGKLFIEDGKDVLRYMLLALEFWDRKQEKIESIYNDLK